VIRKSSFIRGLAFGGREICSLLLFVAAVSFSTPCASAAVSDKTVSDKDGSPAELVNPFIGTGKGPGSSENLFPGAVMPFGMVQFSPDTEDKGLGYHYYQ